MTSKNTTKLLEILKGTKITEPPRFKKIGFKNDNNEVVESVETYLMTARTVECNYSISDTCKDVIAYITKDNQLNVAVANENFISAKLPKKYNEIKICKFNEIYIFLRNEEGMKIYKTVDKKRLEEFATIKYQLEDIVMVDGSTQFYCYIYSDNIHNIYSFKVLGKKLENTLVATYKCPYVANQKRLFVCDEKCYFYEDGQLHNINDKTDFIDGNAIYKSKDGYMVLKEKGNNLLFTPSGTGFTYFIPKIKDAKICVYKELMILYTKEEVYLYTVDANLQLDKVRLKFDCDPESVINTEISIQNKTLMFYLFTMRCKNENLKSKSYDELVTKIDQIKSIPLHKNKMIASDTIPASENNVETIDTPKETVKDNYEDLQRKIERLISNVEEQRKRNEEENKAKFLQLLEVVNNHLNETLVRGIENTIKKEVKLGIGQIKKNLDENIKEIEEKTNKLGNKIEMISKGSYAEDNTRASNYLGTFKEVLMSEILPIVENCFEEIKLQMLSNCNLNEMTSVDDVLKKTISVKDEIANLLESSHANEAVMFAFDCEDPELLLFLIENLSNANIEKLNPHLQYLMIQKAYCLYKEVQNENILICLCNLIMNIDINELKKDMIMDLLAIFDEVVKIEWSEQIHMNLIVKMQRKHAMKKINKNA